METWGLVIDKEIYWKRENMTGFDAYVFILCLIVFSLLTAMFTYLIACMTKMEIELIRCGRRDEAIKKEKEKQLNKNPSRFLFWTSKIVSAVICLALVAVFVFAIYVRTTEDRPANGIPSIKIVKSESMAKRNEKNKYLFENGLKDQFQMFDVIICRHMPDEQDLELYDIVVYKQDDIYIVHRIVGIEEPNASHPDERHFLLQGDAVASPDQFPVLYSQMQGIYDGERIPFIGSFLLFLQSPAGWLCVMLIIFGMIITPIVEKILDRERQKRLALLFPCKSAQSAPVLERQRRTIVVSPDYLLMFRYTDGGGVCEIGTNVLNRYYEDGEVVDAYSLRDKSIIKRHYKQIKIIAVGRLNKRLTVRVDACSKMAHRAIIRAGGVFEAYQNPTSEQDFEVSNDD